MAEDGAGLHAGNGAADEMQIRAADGAGGQANDGIGGLLDFGFAHLIEANIADAVEYYCFQGKSPQAFLGEHRGVPPAGHGRNVV